MTEPTENYGARAGMYRLLVSYSAMALTNDPKGPAVHSSTLDATLADPHLRDIVNYLAGTALGGFIEKCEGNMTAAVELIVRELRTAEDLAALDESGADQ
jgi:hypothetical protein